MDEETMVDVTTDITVISDITTSTTASSLALVDTGMYDVAVSDSITVYSGVYSDSALLIARDLVAGETADYFFSVLDEDSYFLIIAKGGIDSETLQAADCVCYQLDYLSRGQAATTNQYTGYALVVSNEESVQINNALGFLSYSNLPDYPHLEEGSARYEYAEIALLVCFGVAWLIDRIFSHVGNKG